MLSQKDIYQCEWRRYLVQKNMEQITNSIRHERRGHRFAFYSPSLVCSVFSICKLLKQPPEVRYLAIDILDRFLMFHFFQVIDKVMETDSLESDSWKRVIDRILSQNLLRILSTIRLAAKYSSNSEVISTGDSQKLLLKFGVEYSKRNIVKSEARVYQTLQFNIPRVTPLTYIDMFIEDLSTHMLTLNFPAVLNTCVEILDVAIIHHKQIYAKLLHQLTGRTHLRKKEREHFLAIEGDLMFLAAATIRAATVVLDPNRDTAQRVTLSLCNSTEYQKSEIKGLAGFILEIVLENDTTD